MVIIIVAVSLLIMAVGFGAVIWMRRNKKNITEDAPPVTPNKPQEPEISVVPQPEILPPKTPEAAAAIEEPVAIVEESIPAAEEPVAIVEESIPAAEEPVAIVEESIPAAEEPVAIVEESIPAAEEPVAVVEEPIPATEEPVVAKPQTAARIPQDATLRRHFLTHVLFMVKALAPACPTDNTLKRHYAQWVQSQFEACLNDQARLDKLVADYEAAKRTTAG